MVKRIKVICQEYDLWIFVNGCERIWYDVILDPACLDVFKIEIASSATRTPQRAQWPKPCTSTMQVQTSFHGMCWEATFQHVPTLTLFRPHRTLEHAASCCKLCVPSTSVGIAKHLLLQWRPHDKFGSEGTKCVKLPEPVLYPAS